MVYSETSTGFSFVVLKLCKISPTSLTSREVHHVWLTRELSRQKLLASMVTHRVPRSGDSEKKHVRFVWPWIKRMKKKSNAYRYTYQAHMNICIKYRQTKDNKYLIVIRRYNIWKTSNTSQDLLRTVSDLQWVLLMIPLNLGIYDMKKKQRATAGSGVRTEGETKTQKRVL